MSQFYANIAGMREQQARLALTRSKLVAASGGMAATCKKLNGYGMCASATPQIQRQIHRLNDVVGRIDSMRSALGNCAAFYERAENGILFNRKWGSLSSLADLLKGGAILTGGGIGFVYSGAFCKSLQEKKSNYSSGGKRKSEAEVVKEWGSEKGKAEKKKKENKPDVELVLIEKKLLDKSGSVVSGKAGFAPIDGLTLDMEGKVLSGKISSKAKISNKGASLDLGVSGAIVASSLTAHSKYGDTKLEGELGSAEAKGKFKANLKDGGTVLAEGSAGVYAGKATVSHKGSFLGIEYEASAGVSAGAGISGKAGFEGGKLHLGGNVTLGVGAEAGITIDVVGTVKNWGKALKGAGKALDKWF